RLVTRLADETGEMFNHVSPDGRLYASRGRCGLPERPYRFHDVRTGMLYRNIPGTVGDSRYGFAFCSGGTTLVDLGSSGTITFWDIETGTPRERRNAGRYPNGGFISLSSDARTLAETLLNEGVVALWDKDRGWTHRLSFTEDASPRDSSLVQFLPN